MIHTYRVNEIFESLQGEGYYTGRAAVFLRFAGCNRRCPFCDTDHEHGVEMTADEILARISQYTTRHLIVTGGEPLLQLDEPLIQQLHNGGWYIHVETNGSLPVPDGVDWVACSPKDEPLRIDPADVTELKVVFSTPDVLPQYKKRFPDSMLYIQPCSGERIPEIVQYIKLNPEWRLSLQTHKLINIP